MKLLMTFVLGMLVWFAMSPFSAVSANNYKNLVPAKPVVPQKAVPFTTAEVRLLEGPFKASQDTAAKYLLRLDLDRLLAPYRAGVGLPAKASAYPGWETKTLPGVGLAFYLSGISRLYATTGLDEYGKRMRYVLDELNACQKQSGGFLLGTTNGRAILTRVEREGRYKGFSSWNGTGEATPYYSMEKLFSGLRDAWRIGQQRQALEIAIRLADWLEGHMSHLSDTQLQELMTAEFGGMNWVLADLYADTGDPRYLAMSKRWQHRWLTDALAQGRDDLAEKHANAQFPKISGLAARYPYSGDAADLNTARFFWESVVRHHSYATGGNSESEHFGPPDVLGDKLTPFTEENCNSYNMLRLTSLLFSIEPRVEYADFLERVLYNHILPAQHHDDGRVCYFLPLAPGAAKIYEDSFEEFTCCVCSGMDSYVRHGEYIYGHGANNLFLNLFVASEVNWADKGVTLRQETAFPESELTTLRITCRQPVEFALNVRYPAWAARGMTVRINGTGQPLNGKPGEYCRFARTWRDGDEVEVKIPFSLRTEELPGDSNRIALFCGPILLAGEVAPSTGWPGAADSAATVLLPGGKPLDQWLAPVGNPLTFTTTIAAPKQVKLKPFYQTGEEPYAVYWERLTSMHWKQRAAAWAARVAENRRREERTVDWVDVGNTASETAHGLQGKSTCRQVPLGTITAEGAASPPPTITSHQRVGILQTRNFRLTTGPNSFGYRVKVPDKEPAELICTFFGRQPYPVSNRLFYRITVDGKTVAQERLEADRSFTTGLHVKVIPIPIEMTAGKSAVQILFEPDKGARTDNLMELRVITAAKK